MRPADTSTTPTPAPIADEALVERVARAMMRRIASEEGGLSGVALALHVDHYWHELAGDARAAIAALPPHTGSGDGEVERLRAEVSVLRAEMERRDRNETRNCLNWGPCSRNDGRMCEPAALNGGDRD